MDTKNFEERLRQYKNEFAPVVPLQKGDTLLLLDFTENNTELTEEILNDTQLFSNYVNQKLIEAGAIYGIGGYNEHRTIYSRSPVFDSINTEDRRVHLGIDIWGAPHTKVMAPLDGIVHSFAFNNAYGDYGGTIILSHNLDGESFHTIYGHLSLNSIKNVQEGEVFLKGDVLGEFGTPFDNGHWPPHLHFQIIRDMEGMKGDYPGVCALSEREKYLANCPDADLILGLEERVL